MLKVFSVSPLTNSRVVELKLTSVGMFPMTVNVKIKEELHEFDRVTFNGGLTPPRGIKPASSIVIVSFYPSVMSK